MPLYHDASTFLSLRDAGLPVLDARSPLEFAHGHIPGARNVPVLSDEERAAVGTAHARSGPEGAVHLALQLTGPQLASKLARARQLFREHLETMRSLEASAKKERTDLIAITPGSPQSVPRIKADRLRKSRDVLVHCWRGGMRSSSLAWLLETGGFKVHVLEGGYRAYRAQVRAELARRPSCVLVLGGMTGSGKTDMLHELAARGSQVIDLEGLAGHRGSAFGGVGLPDQPGNEVVENTLHEQWRTLDPQRPVWLEDEDRRIGTVSLCGEFFEHIRTSPLVLVDVPLEARVDRLTRMYTGPAWREELITCVNRLRQRLGDEAATRCVTDIAADRFRAAVATILGYYDKLYLRQIDKHNRPLVRRIALDSDAPTPAAQLLAELESQTIL